MTVEASATIASVKGLVVALQAVRTTLKLPCVVTFDSVGLKLRFLDGAHAMQSGISLSASVFSQFHAPSPLSIFVPLSVLLESIATVASSMPQELHFQYPGPNSTLLLTTTEDISGRTCICSYAKVATLAAQDMSVLDEMWDPQDECSQAILSGLLLREAIEDLEWTGGEVQFVMRRNPTRFSLQSVKQQSLEISFPAHVLDGFSCHEDEVCISSRGVLKVTHMLTLAGGGLAPTEAPALLGTFASQGSAQRTCVVQFVIMPHDEAAEQAFLDDEPV
ncbi:hypothetical protein ABPG77_008980 [Micractinium sp. CCAP 211/92]